MTNQRHKISQNVSENFDSDLKKLEVLRVENDSNPIVAYLNINSLGEKINHLRKTCKESSIDILRVAETKLDSSIMCKIYWEFTRFTENLDLK